MAELSMTRLAWLVFRTGPAVPDARSYVEGLARRVHEPSGQSASIAPWRLVGVLRSLTDDEANDQYRMLANRGDVPAFGFSARTIHRLSDGDAENLVLEFPVTERDLVLARLRPASNDGDVPIVVGVSDPVRTEPAAKTSQSGSSPALSLADVDDVERLVTLNWDMDQPQEIRKAAAERLFQLGEIVASFAVGVRHEDADIRRAMVGNLGYTNDARAVPVVIGALSDADDDVRCRAVESLIKLRHFDDPLVETALRRVLAEDPNKEVRAAAEQGLGTPGVQRPR
jgi:HEAT repeat protein